MLIALVPNDCRIAVTKARVSLLGRFERDVFRDNTYLRVVRDLEEHGFTVDWAIIFHTIGVNDDAICSRNDLMEFTTVPPGVGRWLGLARHGVS